MVSAPDTKADIDNWQYYAILDGLNQNDCKVVGSAEPDLKDKFGHTVLTTFNKFKKNCFKIKLLRIQINRPSVHRRTEPTERCKKNTKENI